MFTSPDINLQALAFSHRSFKLGRELATPTTPDSQATE